MSEWIAISVVAVWFLSTWFMLRTVQKEDAAVFDYAFLFGPLSFGFLAYYWLEENLFPPVRRTYRRAIRAARAAIRKAQGAE